jgi:serine/threonine protein kinase
MHRDIKLENIMLRSKGSLDVVIVDFGLAAMSDD